MTANSQKVAEINRQDDSSHPETDLTTPASLCQRYRFIREIGHGAQGKLYLAQRLIDGREVAVKQLRIDSVKTWKEYTLFQREAEVLSELHVDGVATFYEAMDCLNDNPPCSYIVQEYIEGQSLSQLLKNGHRFDVETVYDIILQILAILQKLQDRTPPVIHRDIKPSNIVLKKQEDGHDKVYLIDFGAVANPQVQSGGSTVAGTYGYMPPEQLMGKPVPASDVYSLGAVAVYMLSGISPADMMVKDFRLVFEPDLSHVPPKVCQVLRRMLDPNTETRLSNIDELIAWFKAFKENVIPDKEDSIRFQTSEKQYNKKLLKVSNYGEAGNLALWDALPDNVPRSVPEAMNQLTFHYDRLDYRMISHYNLHSLIREHYHIDVDIMNWVIFALLLVISIFSFLIAQIASSLDEMLIMLIIGGVALSLLVIYSIAHFVHYYNFGDLWLLNKLIQIVVKQYYTVTMPCLQKAYNYSAYHGEERKKLYSLHWIYDEISDDYRKHLSWSLSKLFDIKDFETHIDIYEQNYIERIYDFLERGHKQIARISKITYVPCYLHDKISHHNEAHETILIESLSPPSFVVFYHFKTHDGRTIKRFFIMHDEPDDLLHVGDPLPVLYCDDKNNAKKIISMPYPLPLDGIIDPIDIMSCGSFEIYGSTSDDNKRVLCNDFEDKPRDYYKEYIETGKESPFELYQYLTQIKSYFEFDHNMQSLYDKLVGMIPETFDFKEGDHLVMIAAVDEMHGIGKDGKIPWDVPKDKMFFKMQTTGFPVMVGRRTYQSWGGHPLENRPCAVWTRRPDLLKNDPDSKEDFTAGKDLSELLAWCRKYSHTVYVCGGSMLYYAVADMATDLLISRIKGDFECEVLFPDIFDDFDIKESIDIFGLKVDHYVRKPKS